MLFVSAFIWKVSIKAIALSFLNQNQTVVNLNLVSLEKWIGKLQKTVDLIFRAGLTWRAFMFSLTQTAIEHDGLDLSHYDIARKDENTIFAKIGLFAGADNAAIH